MTNRSQALAAELGALPTPRLMHDRLVDRAPPIAPATWPADRPAVDRIGVISNPRSHRNRISGTAGPPAGLDVLFDTPRSPDHLAETLMRYAAAKIDLLVVDGGDGTLRDVITAAPQFFGDRMPRLGLAPSGKTNALACDLGLPRDWSIADAVAAARADRFARRAPIEIRRAGGAGPADRGFLFGVGAFVRATELAQRTHRAGAFNGLAVGLSLSLAIAQTLFGSVRNGWRAGERVAIRTEDGRAIDQPFYLLLGSTLERLPLNLRPFGVIRPGMKVLAVEAPPRRLALNIVPLLAGSERPGLKHDGYHRADPQSFELSVERGFILDGELYAGGDLTISTGEPLYFSVP